MLEVLVYTLMHMLVHSLWLMVEVNGTGVGVWLMHLLLYKCWCMVDACLVIQVVRHS